MMQALAAEDNVSFLLAPFCCLILLIAKALAIRDKLQRLSANGGEGSCIFFTHKCSKSGFINKTLLLYTYWEGHRDQMSAFWIKFQKPISNRIEIIRAVLWTLCLYGPIESEIQSWAERLNGFGWSLCVLQQGQECQYQNRVFWQLLFSHRCP